MKKLEAKHYKTTTIKYPYVSVFLLCAKIDFLYYVKLSGIMFVNHTTNLVY